MVWESHLYHDSVRNSMNLIPSEDGENDKIEPQDLNSLEMDRRA